MQIAIVQNNQITSIGHYKDLFPNVSFPSTGPDSEFMALNSALPVQIGEVFDRSLEKLVSCEPYTSNGSVLTYIRVSKTPEELSEEQTQLISLKSTEVRQVRNQLLKDSDWTQLSDAPVNKEAWAAYRQTLRDITLQTGFPFTVDFPVAP